MSVASKNEMQNHIVMLAFFFLFGLQIGLSRSLPHLSNRLTPDEKALQYMLRSEFAHMARAIYPRNRRIHKERVRNEISNFLDYVAHNYNQYIANIIVGASNRGYKINMARSEPVDQRPYITQEDERHNQEAAKRFEDALLRNLTLELADDPPNQRRIINKSNMPMFDHEASKNRATAQHRDYLNQEMGCFVQRSTVCTIDLALRKKCQPRATTSPTAVVMDRCNPSTCACASGHICVPTTVEENAGHDFVIVEYLGKSDYMYFPKLKHENCTCQSCDNMTCIYPFKKASSGCSCECDTEKLRTESPPRDKAFCDSILAGDKRWEKNAGRALMNGLQLGPKCLYGELDLAALILRSCPRKPEFNENNEPKLQCVGD